MFGFEQLCKKPMYHRTISEFKGMKRKDYVMLNKENLFGNEEWFFNKNFIALLDEVIMKNNLYLLTIEQQTFIEQYFILADICSKNGNIAEYETILGDKYAAFDIFLASTEE